MKSTIIFALAVTVFVLVCQCDGRPHKTKPGKQIGEGTPAITQSELRVKRKGLGYAKKYFNITESGKTTEKPGLANLQDAVRGLQYMAGLDETGEIDEPTARAMTWPRCGNVDMLNVELTEEGERKKRYVLTGDYFTWKKMDLTFKIKNYPNTTTSQFITHEDVDEAIATALKLWSDVTPLTFTRIPTESPIGADILLLFGQGAHTAVAGDPPFDGAGGTLAHAFSPNSGWGFLNGDVHYDDAESFTHKKYFGRNLKYVTAHEVGHALGLDHSNVQGSLMWPFILSYTPDYKLPEDDKLGIQAIYGENPNPSVEVEPTTPPPATTPAPLPVYCNMTFDDVAIIRGEIFAFFGKRFWRFSNDGHLVNSEDGTLIRGFFKQVPSVVHAIVERWYDEKIIFVKGKKIWELTTTTVDEGYPKPLSELGVPRLVNCAMHRASDGITYYFKGKLVYPFNEFENAIVETGAQKIHKIFRGIPRGTFVDAAFTGLDGYHYLLVGKDYYTVDPDLNSNAVISNFGRDFLRCPEQ